MKTVAALTVVVALLLGCKPVLRVVGVSPSQAQPGQQVTVTGTGFLKGAEVWFDRQVPASTTFVSSTSLLATVPPTGLVGGPTDVTVINPGKREHTLEDALDVVLGDFEIEYIVPANGLEILSDLSDVGGVIRAKFNRDPDPLTLYDSANPFNGLTSSVTILNSAFERVPGTPDNGAPPLDEFWFTPAGFLLPHGQYTITFDASVKDADGNPLNGGWQATRASFTVGPDIFVPVVRSASPYPDEANVPVDARILIVFNESLDPTSVDTGSILLRQASLPGSPLVPVTVSLEQDGFVVIARPVSNLTPGEIYEVWVTSSVEDVVGNPTVQMSFNFKTAN